MKLNKLAYLFNPAYQLGCLILVLLTILIQPYFDSVSYKSSVPSKVKSCIEKLHTKRTDINNVLPLWCQITANEDKPIPVVLIQPNKDINAGIKSGFFSDAVLEIHPDILQFSHPALYFILGHEYHHYRAHHNGLRTLRNFILISSLFIFIILAIAFSFYEPISKRQHVFSVLSSFVILVFTYNIAYWSFKQNELASDRGSVGVLRAINIDPVTSFEAYDQVSRTLLVRAEQNNRYSCVLDFEADNKLSIHNCNPHPSNEVRANEIRPYLKK